MLYEFVNNVIRDYVYPAMDNNVILYIVFSLLYYLLGGIDDELITLIVLQFISIIACLIYHKSIELKHYIKIYLVIILGHILDSLFRFDTSLRNYLILYYTYNNAIDIINLFGQDDKLKLPKKFVNTIKKLKKE